MYKHKSNRWSDVIDSRLTYSTRSSAVRAARNACKRALNSSVYDAREGPDFIIDTKSCEIGYRFGDRYTFQLRGPALDIYNSLKLGI